jgi:hypothetical protein
MINRYEAAIEGALRDLAVSRSPLNIDPITDMNMDGTSTGIEEVYICMYMNMDIYA